MVMDFLRSCYTTTMRPFRDSDRHVEIKWFFCDPHAQVFPGPQCFTSTNWLKDKEDLGGPGEIPGAPRQWSNGALPAGMVGDHFCGTLEQFAIGGLSTDPPLPVDVQGVPICCSRSPGGIFLGGTAKVLKPGIHPAIGGNLILFGDVLEAPVGYSNPSGQVVLSGHALVETFGFSHPSGYVELFGSGPTAPVGYWTGRGQVVLSGHALEAPVGYWTGRGQVVLSGHAPGHPIASFAPYGNLELFGVVPTVALGYWTGRGQLVLSGSSPAAATGYSGPSGQLVLSGSSPAAATGYSGPSGQLVLSGSSDWFAGFCLGAILCDTFTDSAGTNLTAHTMDSGQSWTVTEGAFSISSDAVTCTSWTDLTFLTDCVAYSNAMTANGSVQAKVTFPASLAYGYLMGRSDGTGSAGVYWGFGIQQFSYGNVLRLVRNNYPSGYVEVGRYTIPNPAGQTHILRIDFYGNNIKCYLDGLLVISASDSHGNANTYYGFTSTIYPLLFNPPTFDNFRVR